MNEQFKEFKIIHKRNTYGFFDSKAIIKKYAGYREEEYFYISNFSFCKDIKDARKEIREKINSFNGVYPFRSNGLIGANWLPSINEVNEQNY